MTARNLQIALTRIAEVIAARDEPQVTLREFIARFRMRDRREMAQFTDGELRELLEMALGHATLPEGATGEAALAYLVAERNGGDPVSAAINALRRQGANDDWSRHALAEWLQESAEQASAQATALQRFHDAKFGREGEAPQ